ncbi:HEPN domain-containing protein [Fibrella arboris]|uniref:HEPN domain-containing protein n=1 Tax=Fibrella arboris TaxID=3242486 RepID=UPI0035225F6B
MKEDISRLMARAYDCLEDARLIYKSGRFTSEPNRSYYAIFDAVNALLRLHDLYANSHRGAKNRFSELFIKTNLLPREAIIWLESCLELRQSGDYDFDYEVSEADAAKCINYASEFILFTDAYLRTQQLKTDDTL